MLTIFRKSANANRFGQHQYHAADSDVNCVLVFVATNNMPLGLELSSRADLGEHHIQDYRYMFYTGDELWEGFMHEVVYKVTDPIKFAAWRKDHPLKSKNNKKRMNPHRLALVTALRRHRNGYGDRHTSGAVEFDVSIPHRCKDFSDLVFAMRSALAEGTPSQQERLTLLDQYLPSNDSWWVDTQTDFEADDYWTMDTMHEGLSSTVEFYSTNPVSGIKHHVEYALLGRGGKHLVITSFDGKPTPEGLDEGILDGDRTKTDEQGVPYIRQFGYDTTDGYSNEWVRGFTAMVTYWNTLNISDLVRAEYDFINQDRVEELIVNELTQRTAEAKRLSDCGQWFAVQTFNNKE